MSMAREKFLALTTEYGSTEDVHAQLRAWADIIEEYDAVCSERDAALKRVGVRGLDPATLRECDAALDFVDDARIKAWRALDAEQRSYMVEDLRTWANLVEAGVAPDGADHGPSPLRIAAAALEALGDP